MRVLAGLFAVAAAIGLASFSPPAAALRATVQDPGKEEEFRHDGHVARIWLNEKRPEVFRDCRGCHVFDAAHAVSAPQEKCSDCHGAGNLTLRYAKEPKRDWSKNLAGYATRTRAVFRHHTHGMLECRECHLSSGDMFVGDFAIVTGPGQCERCHDPKAVAVDKDGRVPGLAKWHLFEGAADEAVAKSLGVPFYPKARTDKERAERLLAAFGGDQGGMNNPAPPIGGDFNHYDHPNIACAECHSNIRSASAAEVGTGQIPDKGCANCHVRNDARAPARGSQQLKSEGTRPLHALGAFAHADHYRVPASTPKPDVASAEGFAALARPAEASCAVCHTYVPNATGVAEHEFPFEKDKSKHRYDDCRSCHAAAVWSTGETPAKALHDSADGAVDDQGGWAECARCHEFGSAAFATARPQQSVQRLTGRTFEFNAQTHPYISTVAKGGSLADCATCHRAKVRELPSRLERRPFRHATHLGPQPTPQDCLGCHPSAKDATSAAALASELRTYTLAGCKNCHLGSTVKEVEVAGEVAPRTVVAFPHAPHVQKAACSECHELAGDGGDITTKAKANSCEQCHDHVAATAGPTTERLFGDEVKSCAKCHHVDAGNKTVPLAVPARRGSEAAKADWRYGVARTQFAGFVDAQFHPLGGECRACHRQVENPNADNMAGANRPRANHVFAQRLSPHRNDVGGKQPAECLRCHWKPYDSPQFNAAVGGSEQEQEWRKAPSSKATREKFGNDALGYPGTGKARG